MQRERWIVAGALSSIALIAGICTAVLTKFAVDPRAVPKSDPSLLLVTENSPLCKRALAAVDREAYAAAILLIGS